MWITFKQITHNIVTVFPREVNVKIRRILAIQVNETLKIEVQFERIHIRDAQQIRHNTIRPAPTSHIEITL